MRPWGLGSRLTLKWALGNLLSDPFLTESPWEQKLEGDGRRGGMRWWSPWASTDYASTVYTATLLFLFTEKLVFDLCLEE